MAHDECDLCGLPVLGRPLREADHAFCCEGCRRVWIAAEDAGLDALLTDPAARRAHASDAAARKAAALAAAGARRETLRVSGMWCASCAGVLEDAILLLPGVLDAEVSYAAGLARISYDPTLTSAADIAERVRVLGYGATPAREASAPDRGVEDVFLRFFVSAVVGMWVMMPALFVFYPAYAVHDYSSARQLALFTGLLAAVVLIYGGWPFLQGAWRAARVGRATMDTLVVLGTWTAWFYSLYATLTSSGPAYFESAAMITTIVLFGRWLEALGTRDAAATLQALTPPAEEAWLLPASGALAQAQRVPVSELTENDLVAVRPGERVPVDGRVTAGESELDTARLTGEPLPRAARTGDEVWAGALNLGGTLTVRATRVGDATWHGRLSALVEDAAFAKTHAQRVADTAASVFVPVVVAVAGATLAITALTGGGAAEAVERAVAVLVVACPCALGLATPLAIANTMSAGARRGLVLRGGPALERAGRVATLAFDKTGTVTMGAPGLQRLLGEDGASLPAEDAGRVLAVAAALEAGDTHPVARAIEEAAADSGAGVGAAVGAGTLAGVEVERVAGRGLRGRVAGSDVLVGSEVLLGEAGLEIPWALAQTIAAARADGALVVLAAVTDETARSRIAALVFADPVRPEAAAAIAAVSGRGVTTALVSGDATATTEAVAGELGIEVTHAEVLPHRKEEVVRLLAEDGPVAFVGDGVNDAAALAAADLAITIAGASDVALAAADVVLTTPEDAHARTSALAAAVPARPLEPLPALLDLATATKRIVGQNLAWAFSYNLVTIPLAAAGVLSPMVAAAAMALSSVAVVANSWRVRAAARA